MDELGSFTNNMSNVIYWWKATLQHLGTISNHGGLGKIKERLLTYSDHVCVLNIYYT